MSQIEVENRHADAEAHIRTTVMNEICEVMHRAGLPPMAVMRLVARSIGTIYREMADAHSGVDACPCGWQPNPKTDMEILSSALLAACERRRTADLRLMPIAGRA
ncbi:hypothetical protein CYK37_24945 [Mesorhizobium loti]|nr:hypothetical protein [Mesorhizobium loti]PLP56682.1 hypothetical protein CYK37_24945 [Mesorhizobium loti]